MVRKSETVPKFVIRRRLKYTRKDPSRFLTKKKCLKAAKAYRKKSVWSAGVVCKKIPRIDSEWALYVKEDMPLIPRAIRHR